MHSQGFKNSVYPYNPALFKSNNNTKKSPQQAATHGLVYTSEGQRPPSNFHSEAKKALNSTQNTSFLRTSTNNNNIEMMKEYCKK